MASRSARQWSRNEQGTRDKGQGTRRSACGPSEARSRRARASGGGAPRALINADTLCLAHMRLKELFFVLSFSSLLLLIPSVASADITAFLGANPTPSARTVKGAALGIGLVVVGFEFEYAHTNEDRVQAAPGLWTYMFNGMVQTPFPIAGMQFYGTAGAGGFHETLNATSETNVGINIGGGIKMSLVGPLRLRFDYRVFTLQGSP